MRFQGTAYRAHDPKWSFLPLSGEGAAVHGGRFNSKGSPALCLGLTPMTAIKEASQGFAFKFDPCMLCSYEVDCEDVVDLRDQAAQTGQGITPAAMACGWMSIAKSGREPPTWAIARKLVDSGAAGVLVPSFAPGAALDDYNLVLWSWSNAPPYFCTVHDPSGRLPVDQLSWPVRP